MRVVGQRDMLYMVYLHQQLALSISTRRCSMAVFRNRCHKAQLLACTLIKVLEAGANAVQWLLVAETAHGGQCRFSGGK